MSLEITKTLTSAQILALETTPTNIIPAQGAGTLIIVDNVEYIGTGAYTQADGAGLVYHGTSQGADATYGNAQNPFINGVYAAGSIFIVSANGNLTAALGLGVDFAAITTNPTVGTTPVTVKVQYRVITGL